LGTPNESRELKIRKSLTPSLSQKSIDVFAWSYKDTPDIDWDIAEHKISLHPDAKLVKQKLYRMKPE